MTSLLNPHRYAVVGTPFATDYVSGYVPNGVTVSSAFAAGPAGSTTADKLVEDTNTSPHVVYKDFTGSAGVASAVFYLKAAGRDFGMAAILPNGAAQRFIAVVDLTTGSVTDTENVGGATGTGCNVADAGGGWWRIEIFADHAGGTLYREAGVSNSGAPGYNMFGEPNYLGDGASGVLLAR